MLMMLLLMMSPKLIFGDFTELFIFPANGFPIPPRAPRVFFMRGDTSGARRESMLIPLCDDFETYELVGALPE